MKMVVKHFQFEDASVEVKFAKEKQQLSSRVWNNENMKVIERGVVMGNTIPLGMVNVWRAITLLAFSSEHCRV